MSAQIPQISIVVPFYNVELYFHQFLDSLLPIEDNIEVILVDDGSKDSSIDIAIDFTQRFDNVTLYRKENGGLSSARNYGLQFAKGEYVVFFDSDDYIENKSAINKMFETAKQNNSDIVMAPYYEFINFDKKKFRFDKINFEGDLVLLEDKMDILFKNNISLAVWDKMYKRDFLKKNDLIFKEGLWFEDLDFIFRSFYSANKVSKIETVLIGYRQRPGSIMRTISSKILDKAIVLDGLYDFLKEKNKLEVYYEKFKILYIKMIFSIIHSVLMNKGDEKVKQGIINNVFDLLFFQKVIKEELTYKSYFSNLEKILFYLIKFKIITRNNVGFIRYFNILRKL
ncbi:glycosyltransferase [Flavobacterium humidisoli]|uniref:Glycosyltransferase n=1 Tax=Flavobacterium humidisoli TaxID=2937442 RepID=A0ABY4LSL4_9FLAO|nr:glycosyltransferase [Flavobacterium humidisoli]UPZ16062.1 glycosyltransferase [Flavobacterium humidisoli]